MIYIQVNLTKFHLIGPKRSNMFFKSYSNDGTLLQLTPDSVFKHGSVTRHCNSLLLNGLTT